MSLKNIALYLYLFLFGSLLVSYAMTKPVYTDESSFMQQYMAIDYTKDKDASIKFYQLRDKYLTSKYDLINYGITIIMIGVLFLGTHLFGGKNLTVPRNKIRLFITGIAAVVLTSAGTILSFSLELLRGDNPHWADSIGIPLSIEPIVFTVLLFWALLHLLFVRGTYTPTAKVLDVFKYPKRNIWLSFISAITLFILLFEISMGQFSMILPAGIWLYYYLSISSVRLRKAA